MNTSSTNRWPNVVGGEELAGKHPGRRDEYRRTADQARAGARKAREMVRRFTA